MRYCVNQNQIQEIEKYTIQDIGIPALVLMERAALAVTEYITTWVKKDVKVWVVCGVGNNGADGIAIARMLHLKGYKVEVVCIGNEQRKSQEYKVQEAIIKRMNIPMISWETWCPKPQDCMVDGMFGIGLGRDIRDEFYELIQKWEQVRNTRTIAIDIPSGISATTGEVLGTAIKADYTITFGYAKVGQFVGAGREYCGKVQVVDIGLDPGAIAQVGWSAQVVEDDDLSVIPERKQSANKGDYGKLLMIVGAEGMSGAAYLSALAAYRTGAGLVKILTVEANRSILQSQLPEAILEVYHPEEVRWLEQVESSCNWATSIVMGPGIGQKSYITSLVEVVLSNAKARNIPIVLDSDALNTIARNKYLVEWLGSHVIITPHMKEMSRLTNIDMGLLKCNPMQYAKEYSVLHGVTCILKDAVSVIVNREGAMFLNVNGSAALAKAGSGDVLAGIVGGLSCIQMNLIEAAVYGAYLHGKAGSQCARELGEHQVLASDVIGYIQWKQEK